MKWIDGGQNLSEATFLNSITTSMAIFDSPDGDNSTAIAK
jgi:hypothetical protein